MSSSAELNGSILTEASYADLWNEKNQNVLVADKIRKALESKGFSKTQIETFTSQWRVASQLRPGSDLANLLYTWA